MTTHKRQAAYRAYVTARWTSGSLRVVLCADQPGSGLSTPQRTGVSSVVGSCCAGSVGQMTVESVASARQGRRNGAKSRLTVRRRPPHPLVPRGNQPTDAAIPCRPLVLPPGGAPEIPTGREHRCPHSRLAEPATCRGGGGATGRESQLLEAHALPYCLASSGMHPGESLRITPALLLSQTGGKLRRGRRDPPHRERVWSSRLQSSHTQAFTADGTDRRHQGGFVSESTSQLPGSRLSHKGKGCQDL